MCSLEPVLRCRIRQDFFTPEFFFGVGHGIELLQCLVPFAILAFLKHSRCIYSKNFFFRELLAFEYRFDGGLEFTAEEILPCGRIGHLWHDGMLKWRSNQLIYCLRALFACWQRMPHYLEKGFVILLVSLLCDCGQCDSPQLSMIHFGLYGNSIFSTLPGFASYKIARCLKWNLATIQKFAYAFSSLPNLAPKTLPSRSAYDRGDEIMPFLWKICHRLL